MKTTKEPIIVALANQKGGVGKTTTAVNLSTAFAAVRKKVLLIDLDPQGNASTGLGIDRTMRKRGSYELITKQFGLAECTQDTLVPGLSIIPSSINLSATEVELAHERNREFYLSSSLNDPFIDQFDYVFIDCPPSLGVITLNALTASDKVVIPLQCEFYALEGLSLLVKTIEHVKNNHNKDLSLGGIVLTMYDSRNNLSNQVASEVKSYFGQYVYDNMIPRNVRVSEAPSHGKPAIVYDMACSGSLAYINLAKEMIKREQAARRVSHVSA